MSAQWCQCSGAFGLRGVFCAPRYTNSSRKPKGSQVIRSFGIHELGGEDEVGGSCQSAWSARPCGRRCADVAGPNPLDPPPSPDPPQNPVTPGTQMTPGIKVPPGTRGNDPGIRTKPKKQ